MKRFFQRGGAWVVGQSVLLGGVVLLAVFSHSGGCHPLIVFAGAVLLLIAAGVSLAGAVALGRNLTPFPKPMEQTQLVRRGIYGVIRHPIYASVIAAALGWALIWQSWPALGLAAVLIPFFHAKAHHEEQWLRRKFPEYAGYEQRVPRFLPWF